jgi:hypothetical protein
LNGRLRTTSRDAGPHERRVRALAMAVVKEAARRSAAHATGREAIAAVMRDEIWLEDWYAKYEREANDD